MNENSYWFMFCAILAISLAWIGTDPLTLIAAFLLWVAAVYFLYQWLLPKRVV